MHMPDCGTDAVRVRLTQTIVAVSILIISIIVYFRDVICATTGHWSLGRRERVMWCWS